jgi:hypothetical protein
LAATELETQQRLEIQYLGYEMVRLEDAAGVEERRLNLARTGKEARRIWARLEELEAIRRDTRERRSALLREIWARG